MKNPLFEFFHTTRDQRVNDALHALAEAGSKRRYCEQLDKFQSVLCRTLDQTYADRVLSKLIALKVCNLLAAEYHFHHRHTRLASRPVQLMVDPSNACQLRCPGCVHSANADWSAHFDWPSGLLSLEDATGLFDQFGPFACATVLYNYGEPLLNKRFPEIVSIAKSYGLFTMTSTNLSLPVPADRLVTCGLDWLTISADGVSQPVYQHFRRKGRISQVLDNVAALVEAKRRHGSETPYLSWQYLTFEHNIGELDSAIELARQLGINDIFISTPFAVDGDDPTVKAVTSPKEGRIICKPAASGASGQDAPLSSIRRDTRIEAEFATSWCDRLRDAGDDEETSKASSPMCSWLYHNLTFDAGRRVMPCCMAPSKEKGERNLVYAQFDGRSSNVTNSPHAVLSRAAFADRAATEVLVRDIDPKELPYCIKCTEKPARSWGMGAAEHMRTLDVRKAIPNDVYKSLRASALHSGA